MESIIMIVLMFGVLYFLLIRPENKRKKQAQTMRDSLKKGDSITTIGGIMGKVVSVTDDSFVIETSEDRVRVQFAKWALSQVGNQTGAETDKKAAKEEKKDDAAETQPEAQEEKAETEKKAEENKDVLDFVKETLGDRVKEVRVSKILKSAPVCMTADGPVSLEMEKYFQRVDPNAAKEMKAARVLELNPDSGAFAALRSALEEDKEKARTYAELLYQQALLIAGFPLEDPAGYTQLVCSLMK